MLSWQLRAEMHQITRLHLPQGGHAIAVQCCDGSVRTERCGAALCSGAMGASCKSVTDSDGDAFCFHNEWDVMAAHTDMESAIEIITSLESYEDTPPNSCLSLLFESVASVFTSTVRRRRAGKLLKCTDEAKTSYNIQSTELCSSWHLPTRKGKGAPDRGLVSRVRVRVEVVAFKSNAKVCF